MKKSKSGCLAVIVIVIVGVGIVSFFQGLGKSEIPDVEGMKVSEAKAALKDVGFTNLKFQDENGNDLSGMSIDDWTLIGQSPNAESKASEDEKILLTCQSPAAAEADKIKSALEKKLGLTPAWTAVQLYGESEYPYGFDLHSAFGVIAEEPVNGDTWFLKATCDVTNAYGAEAKMTCEAHVTGTDDNPVVVDFIVY